MLTGLIRRGARYSIRRRVPVDLIEALGSREIVRALGTSDPRDARTKAAVAWLQIDKEFEAARAALVLTEHAPPTPVTRSPITPEQAHAFQEARDEYQRDAWEHELATFAEREWGEDDDSEAGRLRLALRAAKARWHEELQEARQLTRAAKVVAQGPMLPALIDKWALERKPTGKTIDKAAAVARQFYAVVGPLPVGAITPDHVQAFKDWLVSSGCSPATGANKLNILRALVRYARTNRIISSDPCDGINIEDTEHAKVKRIAYDDVALAAVFGGPVYSQGARPLAGAGEAAYWLPLLSLYTGARLNELGQLRTKDVAQEAYLGPDDTEQSAWVIRIVKDEADGLTLKNENSIRRVPVHQVLQQLGFIRYVEAANSEGRHRLFPDLKADKNGNLTAQFSKWYGRYLRGCDVSDRRITFHSFRHSFKHYARYSGLAADVQNEITGHETGDAGDSYGGLSYELLPLVLGMERYRVPKFAIPMPPPSLA